MTPVRGRKAAVIVPPSPPKSLLCEACKSGELTEIPVVTLSTVRRDRARYSDSFKDQDVASQDRLPPSSVAQRVLGAYPASESGYEKIPPRRGARTSPRLIQSVPHFVTSHEMIIITSQRRCANYHFFNQLW